MNSAILISAEARGDCEGVAKRPAGAQPVVDGLMTDSKAFGPFSESSGLSVQGDEPAEAKDLYLGGHA